MSVREILQRRVDVAQAEETAALNQLRGVMSGAGVLDEFGINISQA